MKGAFQVSSFPNRQYTSKDPLYAEKMEYAKTHDIVVPAVPQSLALA